MARGLFVAMISLLVTGAMTARAQTPLPPSTLTLTMAGPTTASSGQDVAYHLHLSFDPRAFDTGLEVRIPCHTTLLSERLVSGAPPSIEGRDGDRLYWFGSFSYETEAEFEINLHIASDFAGSIQLSAHVPKGYPGTTQSNVVETQVTGPGSDTPCLPAQRPPPGPNDPTCGSPREAGEVAIIGHVTSDHGSVTIPEFNLTVPITSTGCFQFRHLQLPRSPMLVSFITEAEGYRPLRWANYVILDAGAGGPNFNPPMRPGSLLDVFDPCPNLLAHPQTQSAVEQLHASLCAQLLGEPSSTLPQAGTGSDGVDGNQFLALALAAAVAGYVMVVAAFFISRMTSRR